MRGKLVQLALQLFQLSHGRFNFGVNFNFLVFQSAFAVYLCPVAVITARVRKAVFVLLHAGLGRFNIPGNLALLFLQALDIGVLLRYGVLGLFHGPPVLRFRRNPVFLKLARADA